MITNHNYNVFKTSLYRTPWTFVNLELPKKLPPKLMPVNVGSLPLIGYLEQSVARSLTDALTALGKARPKYPYKDLRTSACEFLGLYLRGKPIDSSSNQPIKY
jgi:adenylate/nucleoside-diphosphate kinase